MTKEGIDQDLYFKWLGDKVSCNGARRKLIRQLYFMDFKYKIPKDVNRLGDGLNLRKTFEDESGVTAAEGRPVSVLEVLVALSKRLAEDILGDPDNTGLTARWFWRMVDNLGLTKYIGGKYDKKTAFVVSGIVERWMGREFTPRGKGSPFPLKTASEDQRKVEIWTQMMNYIAENPQFEEEV